MVTKSSLGLFRRAFLRHNPVGHARMTNAGAQAKYYRVAAPISDSLLADHIDGAITLAAQLHNQERSSCAAVDIDHGGPDAVRAVLAAAERLRCAAAGFVLDAGQHNGGHVWLFFEEHHSADDLRALMRDIIEAAGIHTPEVYPDDRDLRLPFGIHRWSGRRGALLIASDAPAIDIDHDPLRALQVFATTYHETADSIVAAAHQRQAARRMQLTPPSEQPPFQRESSAIEVIHAFNASVDLVALLGGQVAHVYADGRTLMHCPCTDGHRNGDKHPSLIVQRGRGKQSGKQICGCYTPSCRLHNAPGQVKDAFETYCILNRLRRGDAIRSLFSPAPAKRPATPPSHKASAPPTREASTPTESLRQTSPAPRKQAQDSPAAPCLRPSEQQLLELYQIKSDWTNAQLAEALEINERTVKAARRRLAELDLITIHDPADGLNPVRVEIRSPVATCTKHDHDHGRVLARKGGDARSPAPAPTRQPLPKDPKLRRIEENRRRTERLKTMTPEELDHKHRVLLATARSRSNPRQRAALEHQAREVAELKARKVYERFAELAEANAASDQAEQDEPIAAEVMQPSPTTAQATSIPPLPSQFIGARPNINHERARLADEIRQIDPSAHVGGLSVYALRAMLYELREK